MKANQYKIGDAVEVRFYNDDYSDFIWKKATLTSVFPRIVDMANGDGILTLSIGTMIRKDPDAPEPTKTSRNLTIEEEHKLFHKALVAIIKDGDTKTPNATVKRMVNHAKEALGEIPI